MLADIFRMSNSLPLSKNTELRKKHEGKNLLLVINWKETNREEIEDSRWIEQTIFILEYVSMFNLCDCEWTCELNTIGWFDKILSEMVLKSDF